MELEKLVAIIQGNIPTRIESATGQSVETITMQELNYIANVSDDIPIAKNITVQTDKLDVLSLTETNDVILGLSSGKSVVIKEDRAGKLILSNLAILRIKDVNILDPYYLCWYINSNTNTIKKMQQGTYAVSIIPLSMLKCFEIKLLPIEKQRLIGEIYELKLRRDRITQMIELKKSYVLSQKLLKVFAKETENGSK